MIGKTSEPVSPPANFSPPVSSSSRHLSGDSERDPASWPNLRRRILDPSVSYIRWLRDGLEQGKSKTVLLFERGSHPFLPFAPIFHWRWLKHAFSTRVTWLQRRNVRFQREAASYTRWGAHELLVVYNSVIQWLERHDDRVAGYPETSHLTVVPCRQCRDMSW